MVLPFLCPLMLRCRESAIDDGYVLPFKRKLRGKVPENLAQVEDYR